ncbi:DUF4198 domain-containing protein [Methanosarcina sp. Mfa9]|uniref:DUF4198 domain-containing protein n=1 Tax=Methanosarcina sp. Mfa9 TaxID=3439063 RepID=UPI003F8755B6
MTEKITQKGTSSPLFTEDIPEDIPDIVRGHEIWVEHDMHEISPGEPVLCDLCFGHNMKSDRAVEVEKVSPTVSGTWGENHDFEVSTADNHLLLRFAPAFEGYHTICAEYNGGILNLPHPGLEGPKYYHQYTKTIIQVGRFQEEYALEPRQELEIIPLEYRQYRVGEKILLKVLYDRCALPGATVYGIHFDNRDNPIEVQTDHEGRAAVELEKDGKWMFKVGHRDPEKGVKGLYDEKVMTATFTIMNIGDNTWK